MPLDGRPCMLKAKNRVMELHVLSTQNLWSATPNCNRAVHKVSHTCLSKCCCMTALAFTETSVTIQHLQTQHSETLPGSPKHIHSQGSATVLPRKNVLAHNGAQLPIQFVPCWDHDWDLQDIKCGWGMHWQQEWGCLLASHLQHIYFADSKVDWANTCHSVDVCTGLINGAHSRSNSHTLQTVAN